MFAIAIWAICVKISRFILTIIDFTIIILTNIDMKGDFRRDSQGNRRFAQSARRRVETDHRCGAEERKRDLRMQTFGSG